MVRDQHTALAVNAWDAVVWIALHEVLGGTEIDDAIAKEFKLFKGGDFGAERVFLGHGRNESGGVVVQVVIGQLDGGVGDKVVQRLHKGGKGGSDFKGVGENGSRLGHCCVRIGLDRFDTQ